MDDDDHFDLWPQFSLKIFEIDVARRRIDVHPVHSVTGGSQCRRRSEARERGRQRLGVSVGFQ
jgi:hypothetical protein